MKTLEAAPPGGEVPAPHSTHQPRENRLSKTLLAPRQVPFARYALLVSWACLFSSILVGLSAGWTRSNIPGELGTAVYLTVLGLIAGLGALYPVSRLIHPSVYSSSSALRATLASYLPYFGAGVICAAIILSLKAAMVDGDRAFPMWLNALLTLLTASAFTVFGLIANHLEEREERISRYLEELEKKIGELQTSRRRIVRAQENVRREVAQQIHGHVQSRLLIARHWLLQAQQTAGEDVEQSARLITRARSLIEETNDAEIRPLARQLHPSIIRMGLLSAMRSLAAEFLCCFEVEVRTTGRLQPSQEWWQTGLSEDLRLIIYRVAEEALNNAQKHAIATRVSLTLDRPRPDLVTVTVQDNGLGFDMATTQPGFGILSMQDFCGAAGGTLHVSSSRGKGTTVTGLFPLSGEESANPLQPTLHARAS